MMTEVKLQRLRAHRNNVHRYERLLATPLSDLERAYVERRLGEERACVEALLQAALPDRLSDEVGDAVSRDPTTKLEMDALLNPAGAFLHPMDVVEDCDLTSYEKRAILSSWAAGACAVKDVSDLNRSSRGTAVSFDDILDALRILDSDREPSAKPDESRTNTPLHNKEESPPRWDF